MASLPDVFWSRFDEVLSREGWTRRDVADRIHRNKNTYTSWFAAQDRPNLRLSDVEEICEALSTTPTQMLTPDESRSQQLEFVFDDDGERHQLELSLNGRTLVLRKKPKSSKNSHRHDG